MLHKVQRQDENQLRESLSPNHVRCAVNLLHWGSGQRTDSGARSEQTQGPALGAPAPEGVPSDLGYLEHRRRICASSRL